MAWLIQAYKHMNICRVRIQLVFVRTCTVGSQLSKPRLSVSGIWMSADVAMFSVPVGKIRCGHWSFATGESKAAVRTTLQNATRFFHPVRSRECYSTLYYSVAN